MEANVIMMSEYRNSSAAVADVEELADEGELLNTPANMASPFVSIEPHTDFGSAVGQAEVAIDLDNPTTNSAGVSVYRANRNSAWVFVQLDTEITGGRAIAQTNQGGIFVAGSGVNYSLVVGLAVAGVVLLLASLMVVGTVIYFVVRPEKWKSTKSSMKKAQMKVKRSFARQV